MGEPNPDRLMEQMTPELFDEWIAFSHVEPFGEDHFQMAMIVSSIFNSQGGKKNGRAFVPNDFLPELPVDQQQSTKEYAAWKAYAEAVQRRKATP